MRTRFTFIVAMAAMVLLAMPARSYAGAKQSAPVTVIPYTIGSTPWVTVYGSLADTRNSADNTSYITCSIGAYSYADGTVLPSANCQAYDAVHNLSAYCYTTNPVMIQTIQSITGDSYVNFYYASSSTTSTCTGMSVTKSSMYSPKTP